MVYSLSMKEWQIYCEKLVQGEALMPKTLSWSIQKTMESSSQPMEFPSSKNIGFFLFMDVT
jgi:hypothetical protein